MDDGPSACRDFWSLVAKGKEKEFKYIYDTNVSSRLGQQLSLSNLGQQLLESSNAALGFALINKSSLWHCTSVIMQTFSDCWTAVTNGLLGWKH